MRARILLSLLLLSSGALAQPRKPPPDKYAKAAGAAFREAMAAEEAGDLRKAQALYEKAFAISPHASTAFNLAEVQMRYRYFSGARRNYELYLALAPGATDAKQVRAMITALETNPVAVTIEATTDPSRSVDLTDAYVIVDGAIVARPGAKLPIVAKIGPGPHTVDVITPVTFAHENFKVSPGEPTNVRVSAPARLDGNVIFSSRHVNALIGAKTLTEDKVTLRAGRHRVALDDRSRECAPITIDAPSGDAVAYTFVAAVELPADHNSDSGLPRCRQIAVTQHKLTF